jgi:isoleucyl-tRNA synthetase
MAPFLSFTAEEAWKIVGHSESIFLEKFTELPAGDEACWPSGRAREIRDLVNKDIEVVRATGAVGSSLQAEVTLTAEPEDLALLQPQGRPEVRLHHLGSDCRGRRCLTTTVKASEHAKCERCWHYREDVGVNPEHPRSAAAATAICTARAKSAPRLDLQSELPAHAGSHFQH